MTFSPELAAIITQHRQRFTTRKTAFGKFLDLEAGCDDGFTNREFFNSYLEDAAYALDAIGEAVQLKSEVEQIETVARALAGLQSAGANLAVQ